MFDARSMVRAHIRQMPAYEPILPFEVLSRQLGRQPAEIVKLDANENPYGLLPAVREALAALPFAHIYPDPGSLALREALSSFHGVPSENLLAGAGADELIDLVLRVVIEPGDTVLNCPPTFGMYRFDGDLNAARVIEVMRREDFSLDLAAIEEAASRYQPKVLFLASPNNPDGSLATPDVLERLLALPWLVVLDEAYIEFAPPGSSLIRQASQRANLVVLRTFSKWAGLAGLRVGYGVFPSALMPYLWKAKQPYNVNVAATEAALVSLQHAEELEEVGRKLLAERERLFAMLRERDCLQPYPSHANFILCRVNGRDAAKLKRDLADEGVLVRYFNKPGLTNCIRVSVGRPQDTDRLAVALDKVLAEKGG
jgi:histidinol-phosphate aminotransferase